MDAPPTSTDQPFRAWRWNGSHFEACDSVPLSDRGFRYGMSIFESVRITGGEPEFFEKHAARLAQACAEREFALDEDALGQAAALFATPALSGFARIYATAGDGPPAAPAAGARLLVLFEERRPPPPEEAWEITFHDESYQALFGGMKTANYWFNCDALANARRRGFEEALLFNDRAELVSACMANVFLVHAEELSTPPRSSGARAGTIREWVINRRKVAERRLRREDVLSADEIFLTSSWIGVMPAAMIEGRPLGHRTVGPKLAAELEARRR